MSSPFLTSALAKPSAFSPPRYALWVNSLWFLSLVISLSCAMLATSLQQWARRYLQHIQPAGRSLHERARARAHSLYGTTKFQFHGRLKRCPLWYIFLCSFSSPASISTRATPTTVFSTVICWVAFLSAVYGFITLANYLARQPILLATFAYSLVHVHPCSVFRP